MNLKIKFAEISDVPLILKFIKKLAEYEKMLDQVVATEELLQDKLFGDKKYAEVILAYVNNEAVGFALFFHKFSTFIGKPSIHLEDLYVIPEMRGNGIAKKLLAFLAQLTLKRDCGRLEWVVLDWNKTARDFYTNIGAKPMDEWIIYRVAGKELHDLSQIASL